MNGYIVSIITRSRWGSSRSFSAVFYLRIALFCLYIVGFYRYIVAFLL